ncbi:MAG: 1-deoxy-D-xylulose-5-phosphate reductoisomerase [Coriobacteriia bacterium]|nr:1-deoxy-D-xylulose-5-phosphate reductoisomerase [Coriobacteriia bacterium]
MSAAHSEIDRKRLRVAILGSTGSIGVQTLEICKKEKDRLKVVALAAHTSVEEIVKQAELFKVEYVALSNEKAALLTATSLSDTDISVLRGSQGIIDMIEVCDPDIVVNALVGAAGLRATVATLSAGKVLALANKESLVAGGDLVMPLAKTGRLLPVDSEHSAIFQCIKKKDRRTLSRIWLTASGGPFRGASIEDLAHILAEQALAHPTWSMGAKITIDSATMMNKGLEVIEAHHLFDLDYDDIEVVVHPQSVIHSMVEYKDGSVIAHLGPTDMRIPIQYALSYPDRWSAPLEPLDMTKLRDLTFEPVDTNTFKCLELGFEAGRTGGTAPAILNAANEIAVEAFLNERLSFLGIPEVVEHTLNSIEIEPVESLDQIELIDLHAREVAQDYIT